MEGKKQKQNTFTKQTSDFYIQFRKMLNWVYVAKYQYGCIFMKIILIQSTMEIQIKEKKIIPMIDINDINLCLYYSILKVAFFTVAITVKKPVRCDCQI